MKKCITLCSLLLLLLSCSLFRKGEKPLPELPPPPNYKPLHIQTFNDIRKSKPQTLSLEISRYKLITDDFARVFFHLIGEDTVFYFYSTTGEFKKRWCGAYFIIENEIVPVAKLEVKETETTKRIPYAFMLVLDHSGSMGDDRAYEIQESAYNFIQNKHPEDLIGVIKYDHRVAVEVPLTSSKEYASSQLVINGLGYYGGWTAISDAIVAGINELNKVSPSYQKVIIVFTDGWDNSSHYYPYDVINYAIQNNVSICGIDFGYNINEGFMEYYARKTGGIYKHIYSKYEFNLVFNDIAKRYEKYYYADIELPIYGQQFFILKYCTDYAVLEDTILIETDLDTGKVYTLKVYFDFDKYNLKPESYTAIKSIARMMKKFPSMVIEISGHTDSINRSNDPNYNKNLSQKRADEVKKAIVKEGIDPSRIIAIGYGETRPIADNSTEEGRAKNRRTEFRIIKWQR
ncbi:VWA domain-containing protein [Bacteroidetes/Chlorobi group bacterium Naka2016]|jgi:outer membrane protein OmpA-like peptidoglycan-associated protein/Mg-chelatase subunit ChlD|nr:MAG: VWA domain-containing protein [Bacteroidetes/Chlorobi group bacterium Naka2016]